MRRFKNGATMPLTFRWKVVVISTIWWSFDVPITKTTTHYAFKKHTWSVDTTSGTDRNPRNELWVITVLLTHASYNRSPKNGHRSQRNRIDYTLHIHHYSLLCCRIRHLGWMWYRPRCQCRAYPSWTSSWIRISPPKMQEKSVFMNLSMRVGPFWIYELSSHAVRSRLSDDARFLTGTEFAHLLELLIWLVK